MSERRCEGKVDIFLKGTGTDSAKYLTSFTCPGPHNCFEKSIWGDVEGLVGVGIDGLASQLTGLPETQVTASFNSGCVLIKKTNQT